jgi:hypothetical protein
VRAYPLPSPHLLLDQPDLVRPQPVQRIHPLVDLALERGDLLPKVIPVPLTLAAAPLPLTLAAAPLPLACSRSERERGTGGEGQISGAAFCR